jgi:tetratricopeptide (TPR) repeat protein
MQEICSDDIAELMDTARRAQIAKHYLAALAAYETAAAAKPQCLSVLVNIASVLRELGRLYDAEAVSRVLGAEPQNIFALLELGHARCRRGDRLAALRAYEAAATADPQRLGILVHIAALLREPGRLEDAEAALRRLLDTEPQNIFALIEFQQAVNKEDGDLLWLSTAPGVLTRAFAQIVAESAPYTAALDHVALLDVNRLRRNVDLHCPAHYKTNTSTLASKRSQSREATRGRIPSSHRQDRTFAAPGRSAERHDSTNALSLPLSAAYYEEVNNG